MCNHPLDAWKNIPMMAIIASLPFPSSADNFLVISCMVAGGQDLEAEHARCGWGAGRLVTETSLRRMPCTQGFGPILRQ